MADEYSNPWGADDAGGQILKQALAKFPTLASGAVGDDLASIDDDVDVDDDVEEEDGALRTEAPEETTAATIAATVAAPVVTADKKENDTPKAGKRFVLWWSEFAGAGFSSEKPVDT